MPGLSHCIRAVCQICQRGCRLSVRSDKCSLDPVKSIGPRNYLGLNHGNNKGPGVFYGYTESSTKPPKNLICTFPSYLFLTSQIATCITSYLQLPHLWGVFAWYGMHKYSHYNYVPFKQGPIQYYFPNWTAMKTTEQKWNTFGLPLCVVQKQVNVL